MNAKLALGCMRVGDKSQKEMEALLDKACEVGVECIDLADIYGGGESEKQVGKVLTQKSDLREKLVIQSKCGIVPGQRFDFSREYIIKAVEGSLKRLQVDSLDRLLLHRPDALADYEELAETFEILHRDGKVKAFGVSNFNSFQIRLLQREMKMPIVANQIQFSLLHCPSVDEGFRANMKGNDFGDDVLSFCQWEGIPVQAWSVLSESFDKPCFVGNPEHKELNQCLDRLAEKYEVSNSAIAIAWIMRHPAGIVPVVGTTRADRLEQMAKATEIMLERQDWYDLYLSTGKMLP